MKQIDPIELQNFASDLGVFADIGTDAPVVVTTPAGTAITLVRKGDRSEFLFTPSGEIIERFAGEEVKHANFRAILGSDRYGNIRDWIAKQSAYINAELASVGALLQVKGIVNNGIENLDINAVEELLSAPQPPDSTRVLLIDGPAGIGKTQFITSLVARRIEQFNRLRRPLILHVQSRGRTLSYLYDLIAFSLQRMRLDVTFDQVPILAKHGLITLAIDGFDELADPDGYDQAWSQVSDLVHLLRGAGTLILAGRETFIGRDRVLSEISALRADRDDLTVLTLQPPTKTTAIAWLRNQGWGEDQVSSIEGYLEPSSLALRPFFLRTLSDPGVARMVESTASTSVLSILMEAMVEREIGKFGEQIDRVLTEDERRLFIHNLLGEVARDMAESATSSISDATLAWMVEVALPKEVPDDVKRILKARIQALAFFANDDRKGYRRFFHEKFFEYFLANSIIELISNGESGKILSRTIFGSSLLETFCDIISVGEGRKGRAEFIHSAINIIDSYPPIDRTRKNVAALAVSSLAVVDSVGDVCICDVDIDEARFFGTAAPAGVKNAVINQFDCRGGNISSINFENVSILTLIADGETLLPDDFPLPTRVRDLTLSGETLFSPDEVKVWVLSHLENPPHHEKSLIPAELKDHPAIKLLHKACRLRQYWLRRGDDMYASRILDDANWQIIEEILNSNNLLRVEIRQASGNDARFIHIRMTDQILQEDSGEPDIKNMYEALVEKLKT